MAVVPEAPAYPPEALAEFARLQEECKLCYQCGTCTSSCPSGRELYRGPRRLVRLVLAGDMAAALRSDDLWRCTGCGTCSEVCRMDIDVAGVLERLRALERRYGRLRCPEREAAAVAADELGRRPRLDNLRFGARLALRGHLPKDKVAALEAGLEALRGRLASGGSAPPARDERLEPLAFYPGCSLSQDPGLHALVREVAAGFGLRLEEPAAVACCGHPAREGGATRYRPEGPVATVCPACDASLGEAGATTTPLWTVLTGRARRQGRSLRAAAPAFVPYVGCLADRDEALAGLAAAAGLAGCRMVTDYPSLHNGCCGAVGGVYRGPTKASAMLLRFAAAAGAPVVTTCLLCRDNLRSAARQLRLDVPVHFWPEFFRAASAPEEGHHEHA